MPYVLAFAGGLAGSLHCIGMCGGLVAIVASASPARSWRRVLIYNVSRVSMLGVIGALAGALGAAA
ncbi:MAG: sulfite exporter TauE/SafE family protein, partial [Candidatus Binatia bacterium]